MLLGRRRCSSNLRRIWIIRILLQREWPKTLTLLCVGRVPRHCYRQLRLSLLVEGIPKDSIPIFRGPILSTMRWTALLPLVVLTVRSMTRMLHPLRVVKCVRRLVSTLILAVSRSLLLVPASRAFPHVGLKLLGSCIPELGWICSGLTNLWTSRVCLRADSITAFFHCSDDFSSVS